MFNKERSFYAKQHKTFSLKCSKDIVIEEHFNSLIKVYYCL